MTTFRLGDSFRGEPGDSITGESITKLVDSSVDSTFGTYGGTNDWWFHPVQCYSTPTFTTYEFADAIPWGKERILRNMKRLWDMMMTSIDNLYRILIDVKTDSKWHWGSGRCRLLSLSFWLCLFPLSGRPKLMQWRHERSKNLIRRKIEDHSRRTASRHPKTRWCCPKRS